MKLNFIDYKLKKRTLFIYKKYKCSNTIIPIGCDCHPAYILNALELRKKSFPFDWLYIDSKYGLDYVKENVENKFKYFLADLNLNKRGYPFASKYPYVEFFHEKNLISSENDRNKMKRRAERFLEQIKRKRLIFLYFINPENFSSESEIIVFINSLKQFENFISNKHQLNIFIKYDETSVIDLDMAKKLYEKLVENSNAIIRLYYLNRKKYGIWGNSKDYYPLLKNADISIKRAIIPGLKIS